MNLFTLAAFPRFRLLALSCLLAGCAATQPPEIDELTVITNGVYDEGRDMTIPIPDGWKARGGGGRNSSGCFYFDDEETEEEQAQLCISQNPWDDVPERGRQLIAGRAGVSTRTTPGGAVYHIVRAKVVGSVVVDDMSGEVAELILEGADNLLRISITDLEKKPEVARVLISIFDQVVWSPVPSGRYRYEVRDFFKWRSAR